MNIDDVLSTDENAIFIVDGAKVKGENIFNYLQDSNKSLNEHEIFYRDKQLDTFIEGGSYSPQFDKPTFIAWHFDEGIYKNMMFKINEFMDANNFTYYQVTMHINWRKRNLGIYTCINEAKMATNYFVKDCLND